MMAKSHDGQFTANLTGVDSNAELPRKMRPSSGYEGGVLGEFYGPAAEEVGGVFNASRDDRVMQGVIARKAGRRELDSEYRLRQDSTRSMASPV